MASKLMAPPRPPRRPLSFGLICWQRERATATAAATANATAAAATLLRAMLMQFFPFCLYER